MSNKASSKKKKGKFRNMKPIKTIKISLEMFVSNIYQA